MPLKMRAPYLPRIIRAPTARAGARVPAGRGRGAIGPGGIDTSSTGNVGGDIVKAIGNMIQQNRMNAVANQILNTQNPPRAGLVAPGVNPVTGTANVIRPGTPTLGTPPQTGGVGELQMRQAMAQQDQANQLAQAKIASEIALARSRQIASRGNVVPSGSGSLWRRQMTPDGQPQQLGGRGGKPGKPAAYVSGTGDVQNDSSTDNFNQIRADFDSQHGKGSYDAFTRNLGALQDDGKGSMVLQDQNGKILFSVPKSDVPYWTQRVNAARAAGGQGYLGDPPPGQNPNSGQPGGSQVNPFVPKDNLEVRSLPYGSYMIDPQTGQLTIKQRPAQGTGQQQPAQTTAQQPSEQTSDQTTDQAQAPDDTTEAPDDTTASADQVAASPDQLAQAGQDQEEARRRQAMLSLAMNQAGAGNLYPAQDVMS